MKNTLQRIVALMLLILAVSAVCTSALAEWVVEWPDGHTESFKDKADAQKALNTPQLVATGLKTDKNGEIVIPAQYAQGDPALMFDRMYVVETWKTEKYTTHTGKIDLIAGEEVEVVNRKKEGPVTYPFIFTKEWHGGVDENTVFSLYQGEKQVKTFTMKDLQGNRIKVKKTVDGETWTMTIYLRQPVTGCYVIENVPKGYSARYENGSSKETSKCLNGGKIVNVKIPKTGDSAPLMLWGLTAATALAVAALVLTKRRSHGQV